MTNIHKETINGAEENNFPIVRDFKKVYRKNWRQITSISPGLVLLLCSGVHILNVILEVRWHVLHGDKRYWSAFFIYSSWFCGAPVGFFLSAIDTQKLRKRNIYILSSCLLGISSILLITSSAQFRHPNSYAVIGRFLAGVTHSFVYHTVLIHSGELGVRSIRHLIIRPIGVAVLLGTAIHYIIYLILDTNDNHFVLPGIISLVLSVIALILSIVFTYESVPWLIRCGNNPTLALQTWLILQNEPSVASDSPLIQEFNELKKETEETNRLSSNVLGDGNAAALLKCIGVRILAAIVSSPAIFALITLAEHTETFSIIGIIIRLVFAILWLYFLIDKLRKDEGAIPIAILLGIALIVANLCSIFDWFNWFTNYLWHMVLYILLTLPVYEYMGHVYLSEVFPFAKKDWSIAYVLIIEYVVHILLIASAVFVPWQSSHIVLLVVGGIMTALGFTLYGVVSEREMLMLREDRRTLRRASAIGITINS